MISSILPLRYVAYWFAQSGYLLSYRGRTLQEVDFTPAQSNHEVQDKHISKERTLSCGQYKIIINNYYVSSHRQYIPYIHTGYGGDDKFIQ